MLYTKSLLITLAISSSLLAQEPQISTIQNTDIPQNETALTTEITVAETIPTAWYNKWGKAGTAAIVCAITYTAAAYYNLVPTPTHIFHFFKSLCTTCTTPAIPQTTIPSQLRQDIEALKQEIKNDESKRPTPLTAPTNQPGAQNQTDTASNNTNQQELQTTGSTDTHTNATEQKKNNTAENLTVHNNTEIKKSSENNEALSSLHQSNDGQAIQPSNNTNATTESAFGKAAAWLRTTFVNTLKQLPVAQTEAHAHDYH